MTSIFLYEYLSGGGAPVGDTAAAAALLPQGLAMRDAVAADLLDSDCQLTVATTPDNLLPMRGAAFACAQRGETPLDFVARQARQHDAVWVIAPESDGLLAGFEAAVHEHARWLGCDAGAITLASSKAATVERLRAYSVTTPLADMFAGNERWVVKPDDGAGTVDTCVHEGRAAALRATAERHSRAWVEPWIDGAPMSLVLLMQHGCAELLSVNRQRIALAADGSVRYHGVDIDVLPNRDARRPALVALAEHTACAMPGLRGLVGIDFIWHAQWGPVAIEVNPRVTCACVGLSQRLQRNVVRDAIACCND